jgi:hypothetical protein
MMEIFLEKYKKLLKVLFSDVELVEKYFEGGHFRRRYRCARGMTFTFENHDKGYFLYISFDRYNDPGVLLQIDRGQSIEELQVLWELAHLPFAKIYSSNVRLFNGRNAKLIDTVRFEVRNVGYGVWEAGGEESEVDRQNRQLKLDGLKEGVPAIYSERTPDVIAANQAESAIGKVIFADLVTGGGDPESFAPGISEERDPNKITECDGCEDLFYENELTEIRPELWLCQFCRISPGVAQAFGLTPDEIPILGSKVCDGCDILLTMVELTEVEPGRWLCDECARRDSDA